MLNVEFPAINRRVDGDRGVTVNTEVCGAFDSGSIPDGRPTIRNV